MTKPSLKKIKHPKIDVASLSWLWLIENLSLTRTRSLCFMRTIVWTKCRCEPVHCVLCASECVATQPLFRCPRVLQPESLCINSAMAWRKQKADQYRLWMEPSEPCRLVGPHCQDDVTTPACGPELCEQRQGHHGCPIRSLFLLLKTCHQHVSCGISFTWGMSMSKCPAKNCD